MDIVTRVLRKAQEEREFLEDLRLLNIAANVVDCGGDPDSPEFWEQSMATAGRLDAAVAAMKSGRILVWDECDEPEVACSEPCAGNTEGE